MSASKVASTRSDRAAGTTRPRPPRWGVLVVVTALAATAAWVMFRDGSTPTGLEISSARAGESSGQSAAVYLDLTPAAEDVLLSAESEASAEVSLHQATVTDGLTTMELVDSISLPAGQSTSFEPGGSHLMLENLRAPLRPGDTIEVTLHLERAGARAVRVEVVALPELVEDRS